jgi:photosystem II stability/assembly factor-like uncharacterized protein
MFGHSSGICLGSPVAIMMVLAQLQSFKDIALAPTTASEMRTLPRLTLTCYSHVPSVGVAMGSAESVVSQCTIRTRGTVVLDGTTIRHSVCWVWGGDV